MNKTPLSADDISQEDTIRLVRVAIMCADLLPDFDVINDLYVDGKSKYIKHKLKGPFEIIGTDLDVFSSPFLRAFQKEDEIAERDLQLMFREFSDSIFFLNEEMTALVLMYCKVKSIWLELNQIEFKDLPLEYVKKICNMFTKEVETKYKSVFKLTDKNGKGIPEIINAFQKLSSLIMHSNNQK